VQIVVQLLVMAGRAATAPAAGQEGGSASFRPPSGRAAAAAPRFDEIDWDLVIGDGNDGGDAGWEQHRPPAPQAQMPELEDSSSEEEDDTLDGAEEDDTPEAVDIAASGSPPHAAPNVIWRR